MSSRFFLFAVVLALSLFHNPLGAEPKSSVEESLKELATNPNFVEISNWPGVVVDLKYASTDNFTHTNLYGDWHKAYIHKIAAEKFKKALESLHQTHPGYKIVLFDTLRPRSVQWKLWNIVKGTPQQKYVADPEKGSMHNYGFAMDIGLVDPQGKLVDMGAPFDGFTPLSEPQLEDELLKEGKLTQKQIDSRMILRNAMVGAGFRQLRHEWWHYDALIEEQVRGKFQIVE